MTLTYSARLISLLFGSFFVAYLGTACFVALTARMAIRMAQQLRPRGAAGFLLAVRLLPFAAGLIVSLCLCLPNYLFLEPGGSGEAVGLSFLIAAILGALLIAAAMFRMLRTSIAAILFARNCRRSQQESYPAADAAPAFVIDSPKPFLALAGIVRPRVVVSQTIVAALTADELAVAIGHESAHRSSRDNMKRLCISLLPLPFPSGFGDLERHWSRFAELAADEEAVAGDHHRALLLASALVKAARCGVIAPSGFAISFVGNPPDLSARIDRLLAGTTQPNVPVRHWPSGSLLTFSTFVFVAAILVRLSALGFVQTLLERWIH